MDNSPKISEVTFAVDAVLSDEGPQIELKAEGRKNEFESFFNTMYPVCSRFATHVVKNMKTRGLSPEQDDLIMTSQYTTTYLNMALQIWIGKFMRNQ